MNNAKLHPGLADLVVTQYTGGRDQARRFEGRGNAQFIGGHTYVGDFKDGMMDGEGVYKWSDGTIFTGGFRRNTISGFGTYTWPDGTVYVGNVFRGFRHGQGTLKGMNGSPCYDGEWFLGSRHGHGTLSYNLEQSSRYEGSWVNDNREGRGTMYYASGNIYLGEWSKGIKCGVGKMIWNDRGERYVGSWLNDRQNGRGEHVWIEAQPQHQWLGTQRHMCNRFCGQWEAGVRHGVGTFYYANGARYNGQWFHGIKQGNGLFIHDDGALYAGKFWRDHVQKDDTEREYLDANRIQPNVHLHIGDALGESSTIVDQRRLQKNILRANSELKNIYQAYVTNDIERGVFAMSFRQFRLFCFKTSIIPVVLSVSKVNSILLALRRQHAAVINMAVLKNSKLASIPKNIQPGYTETMCSMPSFDAAEAGTEIDMECEPLLYREFVEAVVRIAIAVAAHHNPELVPSAAFQDVMAKYVRPILPLSTEMPEAALSSNHASISLQRAFFLMFNSETGTDEGRVQKLTRIYSSLCILAQKPAPSDTDSLLFLAEGEVLLSEMQSLLPSKCESTIGILDAAFSNLKTEPTPRPARRLPISTMQRYLPLRACHLSSERISR